MAVPSPALETIQQALEISQQEIDIQAAFMCLIDNDRVILPQLWVGLNLGQQDAIRDDFKYGSRSELLIEADLKTDMSSDRRANLLCQSTRYCRSNCPASRCESRLG